MCGEGEVGGEHVWGGSMCEVGGGREHVWGGRGGGSMCGEEEVGGGACVGRERWEEGGNMCGEGEVGGSMCGEGEVGGGREHVWGGRGGGREGACVGRERWQRIVTSHRTSDNGEKEKEGRGGGRK